MSFIIWGADRITHTWHLKTGLACWTGSAPGLLFI